MLVRDMACSCHGQMKISPGYYGTRWFSTEYRWTTLVFSWDQQVCNDQDIKLAKERICSNNIKSHKDEAVTTTVIVEILFILF